jgi:two-component system sensor histidine kinase PilS (NtrC family)
MLYLMLFRVTVLSIVLGVTSVLYWLSDNDVTSPAALSIYGIIGCTYLLTMIYALGLRARFYPDRLCNLQLGGDLIIAATIVHVTGGAQSAYTFFFPFAIVGAALVRFRAPNSCRPR